ncbi:hypothetical protein BHE74_00027260 [Ensete ventricosum]|nr:hypothetical protein BHE74_00027260 [Ensete ventricosum]
MGGHHSKVFHTDLYRPYRAVWTGPLGYWYVDRPLLGGTTKIDRQRSIDFGRRRLIEGEKGKKKKRKRRKKWRRRIPRAILPRMPINDHGVQKFPGSIQENCRVQSSDNQ